MKEKKMYLTGLTIKNAGKIETAVFKFEPNGLTKIVGMNYQGKSTVLKALNFVLFGKPELPNDFKTHGKRETEIKAQLGDLEIIRTINKKDNLGLKILKGGIPISNPTETFIREFADKKCINPQPFMGKDSKAIYEYLCNYLKIDTIGIDADIAKMEEQRLEKHHELKAIGKPVFTDKVETVDISDLKKEKDKVRKALNELYLQNKKHNDYLRLEHGKAQEKSDKEVNEFNRQQDEYSKKKDEIVGLLRGLQGWGYMGGEVKEWIDTLPIAQEQKSLMKLTEPEYVSEMPDNSELLSIEEKIESAVQINDKARAYQRYIEDTERLDKKQNEYDMFDEQIKTKREERKAMYLKKLPVEGLELKEDAAYHNGFHCDNWSGVEKLDIAIDLLIAENPKLRLIWVDDAEKIDSQMQKIFDEKVKKHDILALMTMVNDIPQKEYFAPGTFYISEGELVNGKAEPSQEEPEAPVLDGSSEDDTIGAEEKLTFLEKIENAKEAFLGITCGREYTSIVHLFLGNLGLTNINEIKDNKNQELILTKLREEFNIIKK